MQMSRQWMYGDRCHPDFIKGMHYFLSVAEANNQSNGFIYCPCSSCKNMKDYSTSKTIHVHLLENGFMPSYNCWTKHGESGVILEDNEEEEDDNYPIFTEDGDSRMGEDEAEERRGTGRPAVRNDYSGSQESRVRHRTIRPSQ